MAPVFLSPLRLLSISAGGLSLSNERLLHLSPLFTHTHTPPPLPPLGVCTGSSTPPIISSPFAFSLSGA